MSDDILPYVSDAFGVAADTEARGESETWDEIIQEIM